MHNLTVTMERAAGPHAGAMSAVQAAHRNGSRRRGAAFLAVLALAASSLAAHAAANLTLGTLVPEGTTYHKSLVEMRDKWRDAPGGGVRLRIFAGGKIGGEAKMVAQMRLGALDAGLLTAVGLSEIEPAVAGLQSMPMMFRSLEEVDYVGRKLQPMIETRLATKGFVVLFWSDAGWVRFFSKAPMVHPDDLRQMKLFVWAGDARTVDIWKTSGFNPVPLETADIVPMLDTGLITAVPMPPIAALAGQVYERAPHMLELNWAPLIGALVIRKASWDRLPQATRDALMKSAEAAGVQNKQLGRAESDRAVAAMKSKGLTVHPVTPKIEAEWREAGEKSYPQVRGTIVPADIFDEVQRLLKEHRSAGGASRP